jgi:predicted AAA+ superfamily ATPase
MDSLLMNNSKKLFSKLYKSDKKLENINSNKAIILVGAKRMGKSTSYNWITGTKLIGVEEEEGGQVIYNVGEHVKRNKI